MAHPFDFDWALPTAPEDVPLPPGLEEQLADIHSLHPRARALAGLLVRCGQTHLFSEWVPGEDAEEKRCLKKEEYGKDHRYHQSFAFFRSGGDERVRNKILASPETPESARAPTAIREAGRPREEFRSGTEEMLGPTR